MIALRCSLLPALLLAPHTDDEKVPRPLNLREDQIADLLAFWRTLISDS